MKKIIAISILALSVYACKSTKSASTASAEITEAQVMHGTTKFPGLTKADLEEERDAKPIAQFAAVSRPCVWHRWRYGDRGKIEMYPMVYWQCRLVG